ncbi:glycoside hydrolase [Mycotypha africana]|uniref:glycoside hydrolase n=1 Tax=Mycotypha africana TaxID=64632 RepID=UPI0023018423|nr:glycoside hydrolase [Mycotypha africana]KAI8973528.1 glycoside hydrolase [Mycotypha africana]
MLIMGLHDEYKKAVDFVHQVDFSNSKDVSKGFETNIRYLGGLLAANELSPDPILLEKAVEVADNTLVPLFVDSVSSGEPVKVPLTYMNLKTKKPVKEQTINLAELGTYTLEFRKLSEVTGDPTYQKLADDLTNAVLNQPTRIPGLYPTSWTVQPFAPVNSSIITVAGGADSFYEYLIKDYLLQTDRNEKVLEAWETSVDSMREYMLSPTTEDPDTQFVAMISNNTVFYNSQELICFWPGNILLGLTQIEEDNKRKKFKNFADTFLKSCIETWSGTATGIAPESWSWNPKDNCLETKLNNLFQKKLQNQQKTMKRDTADHPSFDIDNAIYDLRPETIESVFYYYRMTDDERYKNIAWKMFKAIDKYAKTESGYTIVDNVDVVPVKQQDFQESFWFAETLKYLYLIFVDKDCLSLNDWVFNTEAHPFRLPTKIHFQTS